MSNRSRSVSLPSVLADRDLDGQFGVQLTCLVAHQMKRGGMLGAFRWWGEGPDTHLKSQRSPHSRSSARELAGVDEKIADSP